MPKLQYPIVPLSQDFDRTTFDCGIPEMNEFLVQIANQQGERHLTRTRVVMDDETGRIIGYYTTAIARTDFEEMPVRGFPKKYPFSVGLVAKLAVDQSFQRRGLGTLMLMEALARFELSNRLTALPAVALDLREPDLSTFYEQFGFVTCGGKNKSRMYLPMKAIIKMGLNKDEPDRGII